MIYLSNEPYPQEISVPRSFGVIVPHRNEYLSTADIAADLTTDSDTKVLAASQGVALKAMVDAKADASDVYTKQEVDEALAGKQDELVAGDNITIEGNVISATGGGSGDSYTRAETDALLAEKADVDDVYTKSEVDTALAGKANANAVYTKGEVDAELADKQDVITDLATIRGGAAAGATAVQPAELSAGLATKQDTINDLATIRSGAAAGASAVQPSQMQVALATKQDTLESGVNIKTINNQSLLGSGNIDIQGGGKSIEDVSSADVILAAQVGKSYIWSVIPTSMNIQLPANPADGSEIEMRFLTGLATLPTISFGSTRISWTGGEISLMLDAVHLLKFNYSALGGWACVCDVCYSPFPVLPEGYTVYLWIGKTTGTGYIDTGYAPKTKPRVTTSLMKIGALPDADLFGSNGSPLFIFNPAQTQSGNVPFSFYYKYGNKSSGNIIDVVFNEFVWYDVDAKEDVTFGGHIYSWATAWDYSSNSANIFIFGGRNFRCSNIRMKRTKIYDGDNLVRDLCPCTDPDGNPGMYDLVTEAFYGCAVAGQPLEVGN